MALGLIFGFEVECPLRADFRNALIELAIPKGFERIESTQEQAKSDTIQICSW